MAVAAILGSNLLSYAAQNLQSNSNDIHGNRQQFQQEFQQLGTDLGSGNLSAAQADFAALQQLNPQIGAAATSSSTSASQTGSISQQFTQLSKDLQSGNLSAAQQDYSTIQQDFQNHHAGMHRHGYGHGEGQNENQQSAVTQLLNQLGQQLQTGNVTSAQQTYNSLLQDFQQYAQGGFASTSAAATSGSSLSVTA